MHTKEKVGGKKGRSPKKGPWGVWCGGERAVSFERGKNSAQKEPFRVERGNSEKKKEPGEPLESREMGATGCFRKGGGYERDGGISWGDRNCNRVVYTFTGENFGKTNTFEKEGGSSKWGRGGENFVSKVMPPSKKPYREKGLIKGVHVKYKTLAKKRKKKKKYKHNKSYFKILQDEKRGNFPTTMKKGLLREGKLGEWF